MSITVISQSTEEQKKETKDLFQQCKPYLDKGFTLSKAVQKVLHLTYRSYTNRRWYKNLKEYAETQGYKGR